MNPSKLNPLYQNVISQNALSEPVALVFHSFPPVIRYHRELRLPPQRRLKLQNAIPVDIGLLADHQKVEVAMLVEAPGGEAPVDSEEVQPSAIPSAPRSLSLRMW